MGMSLPLTCTHIDTDRQTKAKKKKKKKKKKGFRNDHRRSTNSCCSAAGAHLEHKNLSNADRVCVVICQKEEIAPCEGRLHTSTDHKDSKAMKTKEKIRGVRGRGCGCNRRCECCFFWGAGRVAVVWAVT